MDIEQAYAALVRQKAERVLWKPLGNAWEFLPKPTHFLSDWKRDAYQLRQLAEWHQWMEVPDFEQELHLGKRAIVVTDAQQSIQYVSSHFLAMTGYSPNEALGKKPKFLQGKETDPETVRKIRKAVEARETIQAALVNYRKEGIPYLCEVRIVPLYTAAGFSHFMAIEQEVEAHQGS